MSNKKRLPTSSTPFQAERLERARLVREEKLETRANLLHTEALPENVRSIIKVDCSRCDRRVRLFDTDEIPKEPLCTQCQAAQRKEKK